MKRLPADRGGYAVADRNRAACRARDRIAGASERDRGYDVGKILAAVARTRTPRACRKPRIPPSSGARRRTSAGRSRSPDADPASPVDLGRQGVRALGGAGRRGRRGIAPPRGGAARASRTSSSIMALDRKTGKVALGEDRARDDAARRGAPAVRHLRLVVRVHRRRARLRLLRLVRALRLRHERQAAVGERPRRQEDAQRVRRGADAGAPRQHDRRAVGSPGAVVHHRARQDDRQGTVARPIGRRSTAGARRSSSSTAAARRSSRAR